MPGRHRNDNHYDFDWTSTPDTSYWPARNNYRIPGEPAHQLVEIPLSMAAVRADYDDQPYQRYVDLSFHPHAIQPGLNSILNETTSLITDTHPSTVLPEVALNPHGLLSFSIDSFRANLANLLDNCMQRNRPIRFVTLSDPRLRPHQTKIQ